MKKNNILENNIFFKSAFKNRNPVTIVLFIIVLFWVYNILSEQFYLKKSNYSICEIYEESIENTSLYGKYRYVVDNEIFYNKISIENSIYGDFFLLKYSINKPNICRIILNKQITDSLQIAKFKEAMLRSQKSEIDAIIQKAKDKIYTKRQPDGADL